MRFVYSMILITNTDIIFILNRMKGEESKTAERQRENVCERQSIAERGGSVSCKTGCWRNVFCEIRIGL